MFNVFFLWVEFTVCIFSLPFPADENEEGGGDADNGGPSHRGMGKGLSREQKEGLDMVKHVMLSLDEEDGLDQIYTFRLNTGYFLCLTSFSFMSFFLYKSLDSFSFFLSFFLSFFQSAIG